MLDQLKTENTGNELSKILVYNSNYIQKCMRRECTAIALQSKCYKNHFD